MIGALFIAAAIATAPADSTPSLMQLSVWAAQYGMEIVPHVERWESTLPLSGAPVDSMEWAVVFYDLFPSLPVEVVEEFGIKSTAEVHIGGKDYMIMTRCHGNGIWGPWSERGRYPGEEE